jgi:hypothetical protein
MKKDFFLPPPPTGEATYGRQFSLIALAELKAKEKCG